MPVAQGIVLRHQVNPKEHTMEPATKLDFDHYGLAVYQTEDGSEYAVGSDQEADAAVADYIKDSIWSFRASFLASHAPLWVTEEIVEAIQSDRCEDANDDLKDMIEAGNGLDHFIEDAVRSDGRGPFLASYDSEEIETGADGVDGLPPGMFAYRIN